MEASSPNAHLNSKDDIDHNLVAPSGESELESGPVKISSSSMDIMPQNQSVNDHQPVASSEELQPANLVKASSSTYAALSNEACILRVRVSAISTNYNGQF